MWPHSTWRAWVLTRLYSTSFIFYSRRSTHNLVPNCTCNLWKTAKWTSGSINIWRTAKEVQTWNTSTLRPYEGHICKLITFLTCNSNRKKTTTEQFALYIYIHIYIYIAFIISYMYIHIYMYISHVCTYIYIHIKMYRVCISFWRLICSKLFEVDLSPFWALSASRLSAWSMGPSCGTFHLAAELNNQGF